MKDIDLKKFKEVFESNPVALLTITIAALRAIETVLAEARTEIKNLILGGETKDD